MAAMTQRAPAADNDKRSQAYQGVRTGGRSARVRQAVLEAAVAELTEHGYEALSFPRVAERAGVHLSTLHRRWAGKPELILDLGTVLTETMVREPQLESLRADLLAHSQAVAAMLRVPAIVMVLRAAFVLPDEQLGELRQRFWSGRFDVAQAIVDRAIVRGEVARGTDGWTVVEPIHAVIWMRLLITGLDVDDELLERLVDRAVASC